jgi:hypothetical protein
MKLIIIILLFFSSQAFSSTKFIKEECSFEQIKKDIKMLRKFEHEKTYNFYAKYIELYSKKYDIHCEIPTLLLRVESNFTIKENKLSGEISIAQINYDYWSKKYPALFNKKLDKNKLLNSNKYAIENMFIILNNIKENYSKNDDFWFLRYNSKYLIHRLAYLDKFETFLYKIDSNRNVFNYNHKEELIKQAVVTYGWKRVVNLYTHLEDRNVESQKYKEQVKLWRAKREASNSPMVTDNN